MVLASKGPNLPEVICLQGAAEHLPTRGWSSGAMVLGKLSFNFDFYVSKIMHL